MKRIKDYGGQAAGKQLSIKYGESSDFYNGSSSTLIRRIAEKTNCPVMGTETENAKWWLILYLGKDADENSEGTYIWRLRDELSQVLDKVDLSYVPLYLDEAPAIWKISHGTDSTGISEQNKIIFDGVELLDLSAIQWSRLNYQKSNRNYEMLINICYFVLDGILETTEKGGYKMEAFSDEHMARLYEKFILEYYRQHHTYLSEAKAAQVKWILNDENDEAMVRFFPIMQTDITLRLDDKILIIDAKYYVHTLQKQFEKYSLHSGNVYQIYAYVKNQDENSTGKASGLLLYAKTEETITPDCFFNMGGNQIGAKTLDLNKNFKYIAVQLDAIAADNFGVYKLYH